MDETQELRTRSSRSTDNRWKILAFDAVRAMVYGTVVIILLMGATVLTGNQQAKLSDLQEQTLKATQAQVCVLALPVFEDVGRVPDDVEQCFIDNDLPVPKQVHTP